MPWDRDDEWDDDTEMVGALPVEFAEQWHDITGEEIAEAVEDGLSGNYGIDDDDL